MENKQAYFLIQQNKKRCGIWYLFSISFKREHLENSKMPRNQRSSRDRELFTLAGWLFADMFLVLAMLFIIASSIPPPSQSTHFADIPLFLFVSQHPFITLTISITILLVPTSFILTMYRLRKRKSQSVSTPERDGSHLLVVSVGEEIDRKAQIDLINKWIQKDEKLKKDLQILLVDNQDTKPVHIGETVKLSTVEERLSLLEERLPLLEKNMISRQKQSLSELLSTLNNFTSILVALPPIVAIILSIIALLYR